MDFGETIGLVRRAQSGDGDAREELFARYLPRTIRIVALRMGRKLAEFADYEDVAQQALLQVSRNLEDFEVRGESGFRHWVALCVEREILKLERQRTAVKRGGGKEKRFGDLGLSACLSGVAGRHAPTPSEVVAQRELEDRIEGALLELSPHHRELIIQRYLCEMSYAEIARNLGIDESTVRGTCRRAEAKLGGLLG